MSPVQGMDHRGTGVAAQTLLAGRVHFGAARFSDDIHALPRRAELADGGTLYWQRDRFHVFHGMGLEPGFSAGASAILVHPALAADMRIGS